MQHILFHKIFTFFDLLFFAMHQCKKVNKEEKSLQIVHVKNHVRATKTFFTTQKCMTIWTIYYCYNQGAYIYPTVHT